MDAAAHLSRYGWRGVGHSLDLQGRGLKKPLLVSHKADNRGIGQKKTAVSDQWWMKAFDESLKELGTGKQTTLQAVQKAGGIERNGLYSFFVRGEGLAGTIGGEDKAAADDSSVSPSPSLASKGPGGESSTEYATAPTSPNDSSDEKTSRKDDARTKRKRSKSKPEKEAEGTGKAGSRSQKLPKSVAKLPEKKRARYEARAAAKGMSIEKYMERRKEKKKEKRAKKTKQGKKSKT